MDPALAGRLTQLFVYHRGERVDYVTAPAGSGKSQAVRTWLETAGAAIDQIWPKPPSPSAIRALDRDVERPTFVVLDDCVPSDELISALVSALEHSTECLRFVVTTTAPPPSALEPLIADGSVRVTTAADLRAAYTPVGPSSGST